MSYIFPAPRYRLQAVSDGARALKGLDENPAGYDVIIVDQKMPQMDGIEFVQKARGRGLVGKILVLSAHLTDEARNAYAQMDVRCILTKPFDIQQLRTAVDAVAA